MSAHGKLAEQGKAVVGQPTDSAVSANSAEHPGTDGEFKHPPWLDAAKLNAELCRAVEKEIRAVRAATKLQMPSYPEGPAKTPVSPPRGIEDLSPVRVCSRSPLCRAVSDRMNAEDMLLVPSREVAISPKSGRPRSPRESGDDYALSDLAGTNLKGAAQSLKHIGRRMQDAWLVEQPGIRKPHNNRARSASKTRPRVRSSSAGATKRPPIAKKRPASPKRNKKKQDPKPAEKCVEFNDGVSDALPSAVGGAETIPSSAYSETQPSDGEMTGSVDRDGDTTDGRAQVSRNVPKRLSDQEFTRGMEAAFANVTPYHTKVKQMPSRHASDASSSSGGFNVGLRSRSRSRSRDSRGRREGPSVERKSHHSPSRGRKHRDVSPQRPSIDSVSASEVEGIVSPGRHFASAIFPIEHTVHHRDSVESVPSSVDDPQKEASAQGQQHTVALASLSKLQQENSRLQTLVTALQTQSAEGNGTALADLANTVATLQAQLAKEKRKPIHLHDEYKSLQQENAVLRAKVDQAILLRDKIELAVDALKEKDAIIHELERRLIAAQHRPNTREPTPSSASPSASSKEIAEYQRANAQLREHNISLSRELKKMMEKDGQSSMHRSEHSEEITYSAPETEGIRDQLASVKKRCGELQELYDDETVLRKRAEKKCQELKEKCAQLERDALDTNKALEDSSRVISEQMATLNGLKDELIRLRRFRSKILAQDEAIGGSATTSGSSRVSSQVSDALAAQRVMTVSQLGGSSSNQSQSSRTDSGVVVFSAKPPSVPEDDSSIVTEAKLQFQRSVTDYSLSEDGSVVTNQTPSQQQLEPRTRTPQTTASTRSSLHSLQAESDKPAGTFRPTSSLTSSPLGPSRPLHEEEAQDSGESCDDTVATTAEEFNPTRADSDESSEDESSEDERDGVSSVKHSFPSTSQSGLDKRNASRKEKGESVYSITAAQYGTSHREELVTLFRKYGDADGVGLMQFTQFTQAAKVVPTQCSNHDVFIVFRSMAHASEEQPYSKVLDSEEFCVAVRKLANWCFARFKCDADYRCASTETASQALEMLLKRF